MVKKSWPIAKTHTAVEMKFLRRAVDKTRTSRKGNKKQEKELLAELEPLVGSTERTD